MSEKDYILEMFASDLGKKEISDDYVDKYIKFIRQEEICESFLLGDFVGDEYTISEDIKLELLNNTKILSEWISKGLKAQMKVGEVLINFEVETESFDDSQDIAYLYLVEKYFDKELKTFIADFVDEKTPQFIDEAMKAFHIEIDGDASDKDDYNEVMARLAKLKEKNNSERRFVIEMYSELYVLRMLKLLAGCGPEGKKILEEYAAEIQRLGYDKNITPELYIKLRKILDRTIERNGGIKALAQKNPQIKLALKELIDPIEYYEKVVKKEPVAIEKKSAAKSSETASKPAAKSAAKAKKEGKAKAASKKASASKPKPKKKEIKGRYIPPKKDEKPGEKKEVSVAPILKGEKASPVKPANNASDEAKQVGVLFQEY